MFDIENDQDGKIHPSFRRVPAIDKCIAIVELLAQSKEPLGISDISAKLHLNKSTVFNIGHTLTDLNIIESQRGGKFVLGTRFYILANMSGMRSALIQTAHPYMERINEKTRLSVFLGLRSDCKATLVDKVDSTYGIKVSSEIGFQMPVLAGAGIKAMLSQLPDQEIDRILSRTELRRYTPKSIIDKAAYKEELLKVRRQGVAFDRQEYIEGMVAFAIPVKAYGTDVQAAIWAVGLTHQVPESAIPELTDFVRGISSEINYRL